MMRLLGYAASDSDNRMIRRAASRAGWQLIGVVHEPAAATGYGVRPRCGGRGRDLPGAVRQRIRAGEADGLVVARLSRLTNSLTELAEILDDAYRNRWILVALDVPVGLAALRAGVGVAAELRHQQIAEATRQALAELKDRGVRLGRPRRCPDEVLARVIADRLAGARLIDICARLNADGIPTPAGATRWYPSHLSRLLRTQDARHFAAGG